MPPSDIYTNNRSVPTQAAQLAYKKAWDPCIWEQSKTNKTSIATNPREGDLEGEGSKLAKHGEWWRQEEAGGSVGGQDNAAAAAAGDGGSDGSHGRPHTAGGGCAALHHPRPGFKHDCEGVW